MVMRECTDTFTVHCTTKKCSTMYNHVLVFKFLIEYAHFDVYNPTALSVKRVPYVVLLLLYLVYDITSHVVDNRHNSSPFRKNWIQLTNHDCQSALYYDNCVGCYVPVLR